MLAHPCRDGKENFPSPQKGFSKAASVFRSACGCAAQPALRRNSTANAAEPTAAQAEKAEHAHLEILPCRPQQGRPNAPRASLRGHTKRFTEVRRPAKRRPLQNQQSLQSTICKSFLAVPAGDGPARRARVTGAKRFAARGTRGWSPGVPHKRKSPILSARGAKSSFRLLSFWIRRGAAAPGVSPSPPTWRPPAGACHLDAGPSAHRMFRRAAGSPPVSFSAPLSGRAVTEGRRSRRSARPCTSRRRQGRPAQAPAQ